MKIVIRAFNKDGYHKDIAILSENQIMMNNNKIGSDCSIEGSIISPSTVFLCPEDFPEADIFQIAFVADSKDLN